METMGVCFNWMACMSVFIFVTLPDKEMMNNKSSFPNVLEIRFNSI